MFVRGSKQVLARKNGNKILKNSEIKRNYATKLSHFVGEKPNTTLSPELANSNLFGEILDHQAEQPARKYKDLLFHFSQNKRWTYSEFNKHVDATAIGLLQSARLTPGDILAATLNNDVENYTVRLATLKTAGIYASIAPDTNGETLTKYLDFLHPKSILTSSSYDNNDKLKDIYTLIPELATRAHGTILTSRRYPKLKSVILPQLKQERGCYPLPSILVYNPFPSPLPALQQTLNPNNFAHLYFVNTSNGDFNAVGFSQKGMLDSARNFGAAIGLTADCRVSSTLGIWHSSTQLLALSSLIFGSYYSISSSVFYPDTFLQSAATDHVSYIVTSPSHLSQILSFPAVGDFDLSSLKTIFIVSSEGEKYSADLVNDAKQKLGKNIEIVFGLNGNETFGPFLSSSSKLNSVGKTLPNSESKIVDQNDKIVPVGQSGRLLTKGASVMKGYYGKDTPVNVLNKEGWLATSFTAKADDEGNFYLV